LNSDWAAFVLVRTGAWGCCEGIGWDGVAFASFLGISFPGRVFLPGVVEDKSWRVKKVCVRKKIWGLKGKRSFENKIDCLPH
jgi:hypothetical protein